jgi:hypothetical protein
MNNLRKKISDIKNNSNIKNNSDIEKEVPFTVEEVTKEEFNDLKFDKTANLYNGILFTVIPLDVEEGSDITPKVQGFHRNKVLLWDDYSSLFKFDDTIWKKIKVKVPKDLLGSRIFKEVSDVYSIDYIPSSWIDYNDVQPKYIE